MNIALESPSVEQSLATTPPELSALDRRRIRKSLIKSRLLEHLTFDSTLARRAIGITGLAASMVLRRLGRSKQAAELSFRLHRADLLPAANRRAERMVRQAAANSARGLPHPLLDFYRDHVDQTPRNDLTDKFFADPACFLNSIAMVLKSPSENEKGVIVVLYSYALPLFAKLFDLHSIARRYHIIIEPSWSGFCNADVLCYTQFDFPVFVQASEPRDLEFIERLNSNLIPVPVSNNWWVDHRVFRPLLNGSKDVDVIMVSSWADYKRHGPFFAALRTLRQSRFRPRVLLLGYPLGRTKQDISQFARYYGVLDQLEIIEGVPPEQVCHHFNRAKVNVLWSRKEGSNRLIIEGMCCDVPCIMREGFNYGHHFPYINEQTGQYCSESELPAVLRTMIEEHDRFHPRQWVVENMSCQHATAIMSDIIRAYALAHGEKWTRGLSVKVNNLHNVGYWNPEDAQRFAKDYDFLRTAARRGIRTV